MVISRGLTRARTAKLTVVSFCAALTYFMLRAAVTSDRVQRDEVIVHSDLVNVARFGHLQEPIAYGAGNGYAVISGVILGVLGYEEPALELLSPVLGAIAIGALTLVAVTIVRQVDPQVGPWVAIGFPAALFVFGGFTLRVAESTHKKFTFILVLTTFLVAFIQYRKNLTDWRWRFLFVGFASSIALFNYVWAMTYGMAAILAQFTSGLPRKRALVAGATPVVVAYVLPVYLPTSRLNVQYTQIFVSALQGEEATPIRVMHTGGISAWPPISVGGVSFSSWFVFSIGVFLVALISGVAGLYALRRFRGDAPPFARFYVVVGVWFSYLVGMMIVAGDVATFRRVLVIPASIGIIYTLYTLASTVELNERQRKLAMTAVVGALLVSSVLAVPRGVLDGGVAPYDYYAEENEVQKFEWWNDYAPRGNCLETHQFVDLTASQMVWGIERHGRAVAVPYDPRASVVYSSGPEAFLSCTENSRVNRYGAS